MERFIMITAIIPIRNDSTRLPQKATGIELYGSGTALDCMIERVSRSKHIQKIIFIMPDTKANDIILDELYDLNNNVSIPISAFKGSINDITGRALKAINWSPKTTIINITADCPLVDPVMIDDMIDKYINFQSDIEPMYISNTITRSWPDGFDIQIYDSELLLDVYPIALGKKETTNLGWDIVNYSGMMQNSFNMINVPAPEEFWYPGWGLTLDYKEDAEVIRTIYNHFDNFDFTAEQVINYLKENPKILKINEKCRRKLAGE